MAFTSLVSTELLKTSWLLSSYPLVGYRNEELCQRAASLASLFHAEPRRDPDSVQNTPQVLTGRRFFKNLPAIIDPRIDQCRREHLALKLGITADVFDLNPGFEQFATQSHLERYLMEYHHSLLVDQRSGELSIRANGTYLRWAEAQKLIEQFPRRASYPLLPWFYGQKGLQSDDMYDWSQLKPYKRVDASAWGFRYLYELVVCCTDTPHKTGDHGFLRLRTPEGDIYSVGLYRPGKRGLSDNWRFPFRLKRGHLMMPDVTEFWPCEIRAVQVAITYEQFERMKRRIETEKAQDQLIFQLFQSNCVLWAKHIAESEGIRLPETANSVVHLLTPRQLEPAITACSSVIPERIQRIISLPLTVALNTFQIALGAGMVDEDVRRANGPGVRPHIACLADIVDPAKLSLHHPYFFGHQTIRTIRTWRENERARLEEQQRLDSRQHNLDRQIDQVNYSLPPS